jgi:selenocysteine lyase/cysteine desulfurase
VFVRGTTEAINLVAASWGQRLQPGDEILITEMEHHSNIVPWQLLCERSGAVLRVAPIDDAGELMLDEFERLLGPRTRLVAVTHLSNALGTINAVKRIIELAHAKGVVVLIDGAQAAPHLEIDVQALDCDFYAFSGHKLYGPTGVGVLYGKAALLQAMPPYQGGGDMIREVTFAKTTFNDLPYKFEAGTPHIAGVIGLGTAIDYVSAIGFDAIAAHEHQLLAYATEQARAVPACASSAPRGQGEHPVVRARRRASARRRHDSRWRGRGGAHGTPLRHAGDGALPCAGNGARLVRPLQHARRSGRAVARRTQGAGGLWPCLTCVISTRRSSSTTTAGPGISGAWRVRTEAPKASIPCVATS